MDFEKPVPHESLPATQPPPYTTSQSNIRRKPVATTNANDTLPTSQYNTPPTPATPNITTQPRPFWTRLRTRYTLLSCRTKLLILAGLLILLALIIGLAAGLSTRKSRTSNLPLPSSHGGPYTGDLTYYDPGLGACGITSSSSDSIVAVSHIIFDVVSTSSNPNANPLCGKKIRARRDGKSVDLTVVDRCVGCQAVDLDVTESVFASVADVSQGRVTVQWSWLEDVPDGAAQG